jgi:Lipocalin-like domain
MKYSRLFSLSTCALLIALFSCKEDDPEPLQSEVQAVLLAGEKGSSKNWKLENVSIQVNGGAVENFEFQPCFLDNVFTFRNNDAQEYEAVEGLTKCESIDPTIVESGTWSFTTNGQILIVLPDVLTDSPGIVFSFLTFPSTVAQLTETNLELNMSFIDEGDQVTYVLQFVKD